MTNPFNETFGATPTEEQQQREEEEQRLDEKYSDYPFDDTCFDYDGDIHDPRQRHHRGFPFLTCDNSIYKYLLEMKETGDEVLAEFQISLINDEYVQRDELQVNTMYVLRDETSRTSQASNLFNNLSTFDGEGYTVKVQVVINVSQYDSQRAVQLLKDAVHTVKAYLEVAGFHSSVYVNKVVPTYVATGRLSQFRLELMCFELDELTDYGHGFRVKPLLSTTEHIVGEEPRNKQFHTL